ncbi:MULTISPECIES: ribosomal protein S18-alanine N-acetyltransferase [Streptacidiphilus]|uniref:Ribosomal protein S18-alanine N-acetyltransferase n=1 Tax=Streptacidiphilus cavernicola TaxID=3342716 RepID=A0ABV6UGK2_9ACTN|nr:ribosomal protein S18-alanine N-acetyltransferase [Streptacidiphilus jeojiense]
MSPGTHPGPDAVPALREMRWWDIAPVLELERELFPEDAWSAGMFWSELADTRHPRATRWYTVAEDAAGAVVGYAGLMAVAGSGDVQTIASATPYWGSGLGGRLLARLIDQAAAVGCEELLLEVRVDNPRAQRLYERFGFRPIGIRPKYYQPSGVDALVMRLDEPGTKHAATKNHDNVGALSQDG